MRTFSKSKLLALRQCPKRLWLEVHRPDLREDSDSTKASFQVGFQVGDIAQRIYDPEGRGVLIDVQSEGFDRAFERSAELLHSIGAVTLNPERDSIIKTHFAGNDIQPLAA